MLAKVSGVELPMPRVTIVPRSHVVGIIQDQVLGNLVTKCYLLMKSQQPLVM